MDLTASNVIESLSEIAPYIEADGGFVEFVEIEEGTNYGKVKDLIDGFYLIRKNKSIQSSYSYECKTCTISRVKKSKKKISDRWEYPDW